MVEEQLIYKIMDSVTNIAIKTGRTKRPDKRPREYARFKWWIPERHSLVVYRTVLRHGMSEEEYGVYASAVEHMEICRNKTWAHQGGRNIASPLCQPLHGPVAMTARGTSGGAVGGKQNSLHKIGMFAPENLGKGGRITFEKGVGCHDPKHRGKGGRRTHELGYLTARMTPEFRSEAGRFGGQVQGKRNVESGQLASISSAGGKVSGRNNVLSGHLARIRTPEHQRKALHMRWHVNRGIINPACPLCSRVV